MRIAYLEITLIDDVVLSAHSATVGAHESLSHLTGATLLGVAASQLYRSLTEADAFTAFHSGKVRFGNGLPLLGATRMAPMPLAFHMEKSAAQNNGDSSSLATDSVYNLASGAMPDAIQLKPLRDGYIDAAGNRVKPRKTYRMKTAINPAERRAAEAQLFGYSALEAGQRFGATITATLDVSEILFNKIVASLCGEVRLGRSRSAEYGRVHIAKCDAFKTFETAQNDSKVVLLAMSDLALVDDAGEAILAPTGTALGLPAAAVDFAGTFIRTRCYAPYNARRRSHDIGRNVIEQGSVITLTGSMPATELASLADGVGIHREAGLGEVLVNAAFLSQYRPEFAKGEDLLQSVVSQARVIRPDPAFITWLRARDVGTTTEMETALQTAAMWLQAYKQCQKSARVYLGLRSGDQVGPASSQWSTVYAAARNTRDAATLPTLFDTTIKRDAKGWSEQFVQGQGLSSFRDWFLARIRESAANERQLITVREFTKLAMDDARRSKSQTLPTRGETV